MNTQSPQRRTLWLGEQGLWWVLQPVQHALHVLAIRCYFPAF